jgi:hypothetical protein
MVMERSFSIPLEMFPDRNTLCHVLEVWRVFYLSNEIHTHDCEVLVKTCRFYDSLRGL